MDGPWHGAGAWYGAMRLRFKTGAAPDDDRPAMIPLAVHAVRQPMARALREHRARGSVIVEFAIVLPLFLALVFGMIDGGRLMMARWLVTYAIDKGGRVATLRSTTTVAQVQNAVAQTASMIGLVASTVNVKVNTVDCSVTPSAFTNRVAGDAIQVFTTYTFKRALPFVFKTATINLAGSTLTTME